MTGLLGRLLCACGLHRWRYGYDEELGVRICTECRIMQEVPGRVRGPR